MSAIPHNHFSPDLLWEVTRKQSSLLVKRRNAGLTRFSKDPLNLLNLHTPRQCGSINNRAIGIHAAPEHKGVIIQTKKAGKQNQPASSLNTTTISNHTSTRKTFRSFANMTGPKSYRDDLRRAGIARISAIRKSQQPRTIAASTRPIAPLKPRGSRAVAVA